jgi:hypothetical protein
MNIDKIHFKVLKMAIFRLKIDNFHANLDSDFSMFVINSLLFIVKKAMDYDIINSDTFTIFQYRNAIFVQ